MVLVIVRHGKAERDSADGTDAGRTLTFQGIKQATWLAMLFHGSLNQGVVRMLTSPVARATHTAEIIADKLGIEPEFDARLSTGRSAQDVLEAIREVEQRDPPEVLILVGHNPHFETLVNELAEGSEGFRSLRTGEACILGFLGNVHRSAGNVLTWLRLDEDAREG